MIRRAQRLRKLADENGAAAVEFALILLPLILVIIGVIDFGRALYTRNNMIQAGDRGARMILLDRAAAEADVIRTVEEAFIAGSDDALGVQAPLATETEGGVEFRRVTLTYDFDLVMPLVVADRITMQHTRRVPVE